MTPAAALAVSKQFYRAFELCRGNGLTSLDGKPSADIPSVVNLAFAIELALKASLLAYSQTSRAHDLSELYSLLPETDRDFILHESGLQVARFSEQLDAAAKSFVEWRYLHEKNGLLSVSLQFLELVWLAVSRLAEQKRREQLSRLRNYAG